QKILQKRAFENEKIEVIWDSAVKEIRGEGKVQSVLLENTKTGEQSDLSTDGVFIYVGMDPLTESVRPLGITNDAGYVLTDEKMYT
ncbi:NAD(P)/FAD-dependent oxidoreductase, partial [Bacillus sp. SIMBA_074]